MLPYRSLRLPSRPRTPRRTHDIPSRSLPHSIRADRHRHKEPMVRRILQHHLPNPSRRPNANSSAPRPRRSRHHDRKARRPILPPSRRHPAPRLLALVRQIRHAPLPHPHEWRRASIQRETRERNDELLPKTETGGVGGSQQLLLAGR